jgi:hypothetical protein
MVPAMRASPAAAAADGYKQLLLGFTLLLWQLEAVQNQIGQ